MLLLVDVTMILMSRSLIFISIKKEQQQDGESVKGRSVVCTLVPQVHMYTGCVLLRIMPLSIFG